MSFNVFDNYNNLLTKLRDIGKEIELLKAKEQTPENVKLLEYWFKKHRETWADLDRVEKYIFPFNDM